MPKTPMHCPFCDIIGGAGEVSVCYEDAVAIAFMDIQPVNDGHVLVVPRTHYERLEDLPLLVDYFVRRYVNSRRSGRTACSPRSLATLVRWRTR